MTTVLLNLDAGERDDETPELWSLFDVLNVACGGHVGDAASMERVVEFCARDPRRLVGAHPSYPDRDGFGRRSIAIEPGALATAIAAQCRSLDAIAVRHARRVVWVKPHGALYHDAAARPDVADAVLRGATEAIDAIIGIVGPPHGALRDATLARGLAYLREGFADRRMRADGSLVPRTEPDALITDPAAAAAQAIALASSVDTICIHADSPGALAIAHAVREALHG